MQAVSGAPLRIVVLHLARLASPDNFELAESGQGTPVACLLAATQIQHPQPGESGQGAEIAYLSTGVQA